MNTFTLKGDEIVLNENTFLVSETDENGVIISANNDFCKVSGYELDELVGNPHKMIKHPSMPKDLLDDFKDPDKKVEIWKGIIKNSTKDSTKFYWTFSIVVPVKDKYQKRFLCLGVKPTDEEIRENSI